MNCWELEFIILVVVIVERLVFGVIFEVWEVVLDVVIFGIV